MPKKTTKKKAPAKKVTKKRATKKKTSRKKTTISKKDIEAQEFESAHEFTRLIRSVEKHTRDLSRIQEILKDLGAIQEVVKNIFQIQDKAEEALYRLTQSEKLAMSVGDAVLLSLFNMAAMKEMPDEEKNKLLMDNITKAIKQFRKPEPIPSSIREGLLETVIQRGIVDV